MTDTNKPIKLTECGLTLAIFANETEHGTRYATELTRSYLKDGKWQRTHVLRERDLLVAGNLQQRGHNAIQTMKQDHKLEAHAEANADANAESAFHDASAPDSAPDAAPAPADM